MAFRQCPKRLWLEVHKPELHANSDGTAARFRGGHQVGEIARRLYDPHDKGVLIDSRTEGGTLKRTLDSMRTPNPVFEAGFSAMGALAFIDIMLPVPGRKHVEWRMVEVKSSTSVKDYHRDDVSIQAFVAKAAGVKLASIAIATINNKWVYPGNGRYEGLLRESDLTEEVSGRAVEMAQWIAEAHKVAKRQKEPSQKTGGHCNSPFECGFLSYCKGQEPQAKHSIDVLPKMSSRLRAYVVEENILELADVPDELLSPIGLRVKKATLSGETFFNAKGAAAALASHKLPAAFLDFETTSMPVPIWAGTRPYQQIPFQFSIHLLDRTGHLTHREHLDLTGKDPSERFALALVDACHGTGPVFVYNATFERARISELAERFTQLKKTLLQISDRLVDLLPVAREHYYHPFQLGSWSIKAVLPAAVPSLNYDDLDGIQDGGMAAEAYLEAIQSSTPAARKETIRKQLLEYCHLDTYAMVRLWQFFSGRRDIRL